MKTIISAALALAVAGVFGLGTLITAVPASAQAQMQQMDKAPAMKAEKKAMKQKVSKKAGSKGVMALQEALNKNGAALKVDGHMGKATRAALKEYQAKNSLKATGRLDKTTRAKLGL